MKRIIRKTIYAIPALYAILCALLFMFQEKLIFFPQKLDKNYRFDFDQNFEEINVKTLDGLFLHGLLFKADSSKGVIFYLHGNAGSLASWGHVAKTYTRLNYDVFMLDYRGYGKSEGSIRGQDELFQDVQAAYDVVKERYQEDRIVVLGYSIGTGPASKVASTNHPKLLILQAPYFSLIDLMRHTYRIIPTSILKYKLETNEYVKKCTMPIVIFHGNEDSVIYYESSIKLKDQLTDQCTLVILDGEGHNGMTDNPVYRKEIEKVLN
ncbi:MAG TPA: alpha/beta fold hydrolase [Chryseolinea sp.]|nr:alpha/beta fold hydrolase [Chryseolinea sp.]